MNRRRARWAHQRAQDAAAGAVLVAMLAVLLVLVLVYGAPA